MARDPAEERLERETDEFERQRRADREADYAPLDPLGEVGSRLYERVRVLGAARWEDLSVEERAPWAAAAELLNEGLRLLHRSAAQIMQDETDSLDAAEEAFERHCEAVLAVMRQNRATLLQELLAMRRAPVEVLAPRPLADVLGEIVAAADTGI